ncbi:hypothetical protein AAA557_06495 [Pseudomonas aeruginosa]
MNKANECTCPSGDGSLRWPCPAHPAEQAGGDERAADEKPRATRCPDCGEHDLMPGDLCACGYETDPAAGCACPECDGSGDGCVGEICRECDGSGWFERPEQARAALAQPSPAQTQPSPAPTLRAAIDVANDRFEVPVAKWGTDLVGEEERPEVVAYFDRNYPSTGDAFIWSNYEGSPYEPVMTVAQHDRIVGALRAENAKLIEALDECDGDRWKLRSERDAALARVAKLEHSQSFQRDIDYSVLSEYAYKHRLHFNNLCAVVRSALIALPAQTQHSVPVAREQLERLVRILDAHNYAKDAEALMALLAAAPGKEGV